MGKDAVDIKISDDLVMGIIEKKVQTAIIEALDSETGVVERVITAALGMKVDSEGKVNSYSSSNKYTLLDVTCKKLIQGAAEAAIKDWVDKRHDVIKAEFMKQLQTKKTSSLLVRACVDGLAAATTSRWRFSVAFDDS